MKIYITGQTGSGKTAVSIALCRLYRYNNPNNIIYANLNLNIKNFIYSQFGFLPFSTIIKGNSLLLLDDFGNLKNTQSYTTYLATISRKTNTYVIITAQRFTQIDKTTRELCHYEVKPELTNLIYNYSKNIYQMTDKTKAILYNYNPISLELESKREIRNIKKLVDNIYDTNELVLMPNERTIKNEIIKNSNDLRDIEYNIQIYTKNRNVQKRLIKEICEYKGINYKI